MDPHTFDGIVRRVSRTLSRRSLVRGTIGASVLAAAGPGDDARAKKARKEGCLPPGKRCGTKKKDPPCRKCCQRYVITDPNGKKKCSCRPEGVGCSDPSQCCSGTCENGVCRTAPCKGLGVACDVNSECCSNACGDGTCRTAPCTNAGGGCTADANCCSGNCQEGLFTITCRSSICSPPDGPCGADANCCEGFCNIFGGVGVCESCGCD